MQASGQSPNLLTGLAFKNMQNKGSILTRKPKVEESFNPLQFLSAAPPGYYSPNRLAIFINAAGSSDFA